MSRSLSARAAAARDAYFESLARSSQTLWEDVADAVVEIAEGVTEGAESRFWADLRTDLEDPEFRREFVDALAKGLPLHLAQAGDPDCPTCDGGGCLDCTEPG